MADQATTKHTNRIGDGGAVISMDDFGGASSDGDAGGNGPLTGGLGSYPGSGGEAGGGGGGGSDGGGGYGTPGKPRGAFRLGDPDYTRRVSGPGVKPPPTISQQFQDFINELNKPLDINDPYVKQIMGNAMSMADTDARNRGIDGAMAVGNAQDQAIRAETSMDMQRKQLGLQALGAYSGRDMDLRKLGLDQYMYDSSRQDAYNWAQKQQSGNVWGDVLGGLGAAAGGVGGFFVGGPMGAAAGAAGGWSLGSGIGQGIGGSGSVPAPTMGPSYSSPSYTPLKYTRGGY